MLIRAATSCLLVGCLAAAELQFAELGDLPLESGELLQDCRLGYRTYGRLNQDRSNAVLWPTWFSGTTENLEDLIGPAKLVDSSVYFVITVDALANGVSSSPSNSPQARQVAFPKISVRDMVDSQHRLVTKVLGLNRLHAVIGISMGGMQTFEWMVAYPHFLKKAIPIVGTPRQTSMDLLLWEAELSIIEAAQKCGCDWRSAMKSVGLIHTFALETPQYRVKQTPAGEFPRLLAAQIDRYAQRNAHDWAAQLRAMMAHDISRRFGGSMEEAAKAVKAEVLVVIATQDHMVNPLPAAEFAELLGAPVVRLEGDCGHRATGCESARLYEAVGRFLAQ